MNNLGKKLIYFYLSEAQKLQLQHWSTRSEEFLQSLSKKVPNLMSQRSKRGCA